MTDTSENALPISVADHSVALQLNGYLTTLLALDRDTLSKPVYIKNTIELKFSIYREIIRLMTTIDPNTYKSIHYQLVDFFAAHREFIDDDHLFQGVNYLENITEQEYTEFLSIMKLIADLAMSDDRYNKVIKQLKLDRIRKTLIPKHADEVIGVISICYNLT